MFPKSALPRDKWYGHIHKHLFMQREYEREYLEGFLFQISKEWFAIDLIIRWSRPVSVCTGRGTKRNTLQLRRVPVSKEWLICYRQRIYQTSHMIWDLAHRESESLFGYLVYKCGNTLRISTRDLL